MAEKIKKEIVESQLNEPKVKESLQKHEVYLGDKTVFTFTNKNKKGDEEPVLICVVDSLPESTPKLFDQIKPFLKETEPGVYGKNFRLDSKEDDVWRTKKRKYPSHGADIIHHITKGKDPSQMQVLNVVYAKEGYGSDVTAWNKALQYCIDNDVDIINLSGGGTKPMAIEKKLISKALDKDITVVAAAGNEAGENDSKYYPSGYKGVISVMNAHVDKGKPIKLSNSSNFDTLGSKYGETVAEGRSELSKTEGTSQAAARMSGYIAEGKWSHQKKEADLVKNLLAKGNVTLPEDVTNQLQEVSEKGHSELSFLKDMEEHYYKKQVSEPEREVAQSESNLGFPSLFGQLEKLYMPFKKIGERLQIGNNASKQDYEADLMDIEKKEMDLIDELHRIETPDLYTDVSQQNEGV